MQAENTNTNVVPFRQAPPTPMPSKTPELAILTAMLQSLDAPRGKRMVRVRQELWKLEQSGDEASKLAVNYVEALVRAER